MPQLNMQGLCIMFMLLAIAMAYVAAELLQKWLVGVLQLKWLILSIVVLYGWFTAGEPIFATSFVNMPTYTGLELAASRLLVLVNIIGLVKLMLYQLGPETLVAALRWLFMPLSYVGLSLDTFSTRLALTLYRVPELQKWLQSPPVTTHSHTAWQRLNHRICHVIQQIEQPAMDDANLLITAQWPLQVLWPAVLITGGLIGLLWLG